MHRSTMRQILTSFLTVLVLAGCGGDENRDAEGASGDSVQLVPVPQSPPVFADDSLPSGDGGAPPLADLPPPIARGEECDPNYEPCVPIDSDVDCAGGRGNGPSYVAGPVRVIGRDIYDLDRDGDGWGCDR
ncbi:MAG TPA: hypothetical protein VF092_10470 [Longimicrobium sp.]